MNKKGNMFSAALIALMLFLVGFTVINFLMTPIDQARIDLSCDDAANITDGVKLMCLGIDSTVIYFILIIFSISMGAIIDKLVI
jgi:hypothetical protein